MPGVLMQRAGTDERPYQVLSLVFLIYVGRSETQEEITCLISDRSQEQKRTRNVAVAHK